MESRIWSAVLCQTKGLGSLLWLLMNSDDPEILGACYSDVLALEGPVAIPWAAQFLPPEDNAAAEAAMAIAQTHTPEAF